MISHISRNVQDIWMGWTSKGQTGNRWAKMAFFFSIPWTRKPNKVLTFHDSTYDVTVYLLEPMFHSWIIVQYKEHCNTQLTWTYYADNVSQLNDIQGKTKLHTNAGRNLVIRQFQCTYYITRLEIFWKEVMSYSNCFHYSSNHDTFTEMWLVFGYYVC